MANARFLRDPARVLESGTIDGASYACHAAGGARLGLVGEFAQGCLDERIGKACAAFAGLAMALDGAHAAGMTHGALGPETIAARGPIGDPRLAPVAFGLSAYVAASRPIEFARYAAPERYGALRRPCDARADLYSLASTLYFAATGEAPYDGESADEVAHLHVAKRAPSLSEYGSGSPAANALDAVLSRALEKEPERRYQCARALAHDLGLVASGRLGFDPGATDVPPRVCWSPGWEAEGGEAPRDASALADGPVAGATTLDKAASVLASCARLATIADADELCETVMREAMRLSGATRGYLFSADGETKALDLRVAVDLDERKVPEYSRSIIRKAYEEGGSVLVRDAAVDPEASGFKSVADLGLRSVVCLPLRVAGSVVGVCYLDNPLASGVFGRDSVAALEAFAALAAIALESSLAREALRIGRTRRLRVSRVGENAIERVMAVLRADLRRDVPREELERVTGFSGDHLGKIFKTHTGMSIAAFVAKARVERAAGLLAGTGDPVTEIAFEAGFGSLNAFYRAFQEATGTTPSDFRKRAKSVGVDNG
jgi:AraC-like DNA-binding protein